MALQCPVTILYYSSKGNPLIIAIEYAESKSVTEKGLIVRHADKLGSEGWHSGRGGSTKPRSDADLTPQGLHLHLPLSAVVCIKQLSREYWFD